MLKRTLVTTAGATVLVAASFGTTVAAAEPVPVPEPVAGCGQGLTLVDWAGVELAVDWSIYPTAAEQDAIKTLIATVDANGDGFYCIKVYKPSNGRDRQWGATDYEVTKIGDNKPRGQLG